MQFFNMKNWLLSICVTVIIISVFTIIAPQGKIGKFIKSIFNIALVLVIVKPVINIDMDSVISKIINSGNEVVFQTEYLNVISERKADIYEKNCILIIEDCGVNDASVVIDYILEEDGFFHIENVSVNLKNSVFISDKEHIDIIDEIRERLGEYLNVKSEAIDIYE